MWWWMGGEPTLKAWLKVNQQVSESGVSVLKCTKRSDNIINENWCNFPGLCWGCTRCDKFRLLNHKFACLIILIC